MTPWSGRLVGLRPLRLVSCALLLIVGAAAPALLGTASPAKAESHSTEASEGLGFRVAPAPEASTSDRGGYFVVDAAPGDEVAEELVVTSTSDRPIEVHLAAVDADTGPTGGASYGRGDQPAEAVGAWLSLDTDRVALEPGEHGTVEVSGQVPENADSGEHLAGVAAWIPAQQDPEQQDDTPGAAIDVQHRRVVAVQFVLPGPAEPALTVTGVEPTVRADGVWLRIAIANDGRGLTTADGVIEVLDPEFAREFHIDTFVPGTAIAYPVLWAETAAEGEYRARVRLDYGTWTERWEGTFTIGPEITDQLDDRGLASPRIPSPPLWLLRALAALAGMLLAVLLAIGWRHLRSPRRLGRHSPGSWTLNPSR